MEGINRLSEMIKGQKDKYLIKIVSYLILQEKMNECYLNEEKNLKDMANYIKKLAKKEAINGVAIIEDETVYQWAKEYFEKSNQELGIENKVVKTNNEKNNNNNNNSNNNNNNVNSKFGSIFGNKEIKKEQEIEQISLFAA